MRLSSSTYQNQHGMPTLAGLSHLADIGFRQIKIILPPPEQRPIMGFDGAITLARGFLQSLRGSAPKS